ncbi:tandem-type lipoprotein [Staphylococcus aureus]|nr:tandem-type lipoprotein [Staphylococcus aureus]
MIHSKKLTLGICLVLLIILIVGYVIMTKTNGRNAQIKDTFNQTLKLYPTKNLDDFYDKEGFRDQEFKKGDKGTWIVNSEMVIEPKGKDMETRGMVLYINRNTRTTKGYYFISEMTDDSNGRPKDDEKRYPVKMEHNKIIPTKPLPNDKLKKRLKTLSSLYNMATLKILMIIKMVIFHIILNVPSYSAKYQLNNDDYNVQQLRKRYDIPTKQAPKLLLKGDGDLKVHP